LIPWTGGTVTATFFDFSSVVSAFQRNLFVVLESLPMNVTRVIRTIPSDNSTSRSVSFSVPAWSTKFVGTSLIVSFEENFRKSNSLSLSIHKLFEIKSLSPRTVFQKGGALMEISFNDVIPLDLVYTIELNVLNRGGIGVDLNGKINLKIHEPVIIGEKMFFTVHSFWSSFQKV
jgi:hypothetical protein